MRAEIYWVEGAPGGRLAVLPRPRGGDWLEDEVLSLRHAGVDVLVSLLTEGEMAELGLVQEADCCARCGIQFVSFPITDRHTPTSVREVMSVVRRLATATAQGHAVAVHCRQGAGRSALLVACVLAALGERPDVAFERIARARGCPVPDTAEQREWVKTFAERLRADAASHRGIRGQQHD
jgi:protein-tyrosine phosphatase